MRIINVFKDYIDDKRFSILYLNNKLDIVNYTSIIDFSDTLISFQYKTFTYHVEGENLSIVKMADDEVLIEGKISKITFL